MPPAPEVVPFAAEHLDAAAEQLAARQRRLRVARPELPESFTDAATCRPLIAALAEKPGAQGLRGGVHLVTRG